MLKKKTNNSNHLLIYYESNKQPFHGHRYHYMHLKNYWNKSNII